MKCITNKGSAVNYLLVSILALCFVLPPVFLQAKELTEQQVRSAVETWVRYITADAQPDAVVEKMEPHVVDGDVLAYIAHLAGGGFCFCGTDDLIPPVILYNPVAKYNPENESYRFVLWEISTRTKNIRKGLLENDPELDQYRQALSERAAYWQDIIAGRIPARKQDDSGRAEPDSMELNMTTRWHQESPYYNYCPLGDQACTLCPDSFPPFARTAVGCVATAMAQIMKYWRWPPSGTGSHSFTWDGDQSCGGSAGGGNLSATFSDAYDWANMPDSCDTGGCTSIERAALAELSYEAGVSVDMDYGVCGSGAYLDTVDDALEDYFRYDYDASFSTEGWWTIGALTSEIQWLRPVAMAGYRPLGGGHTFVVYGYNKRTDPDRQFLTNMGHGSDYYAWYTYDNIPYSDDKQTVTWIAPRDVIRFVGSTPFSGNGTPSDPYVDIEEAILWAPDHATLIFKAGSVNTFSSPTLVIDRPLVLKGEDVVISKE